MEQSFTADMPLLATSSALGLGRRCYSSPQQCYVHRLCSIKDTNTNRSLERWYITETSCEEFTMSCVVFVTYQCLQWAV